MMKKNAGNRKCRICAAAVFAVACFTLLCAGCGSSASEAKSVSREFFAMDTVMQLAVNGRNAESAADLAAAEITRLEKLLDAGAEDSEVGRINAEGKGKLSPDGIALMKEAGLLYEETGGLFDVTVYPVVELWGFISKDYRVPSDGELSKALDLVGMDTIEAFDPESGRLTLGGKGRKIDFGGIAKGYAAERVCTILKEKGIKSALINLGGNVQALGAKPDGSAWRIGIRNPEGGEYLGVVSCKDRAVVTSGGYERYFEQDGKTYHHIIDPRTGYPAESGLVSVTIVTADGLLADGLSTSLFIMGEDEAIRFWRERTDRFDMVLLTADGRLLVSEGLKDSFASSLPVTLIEK